MSSPYVTVSFRNGRAAIAYLYLERKPGDRAAKTTDAGKGLMIDFADDGRAIGVEILSPSIVTLEIVNEALRLARQPAVDAEVLSPLWRPE